MQLEKKKVEVPWALTIYSADNGYVLTNYRELDDGAVRKEFTAIEEPFDGNEAKTAQRLLWEIAEYFGIYKGVKVILIDDDGQEIKDDES